MDRTSCGEAPRPMPISNRPPLSPSSMQISSISLNGLWEGRIMTSGPRRMRFVRCATAAKKRRSGLASSIAASNDARSGGRC